MSTQKKDPLDHKYLNAESSLEEDEQFFKKQEKDGPLKSWAKFRQKSSYQAPGGLSDRIADSIEKKRSNTRTLYVTISSIAASLILIAVFLFGNSGSAEMSYEEKKALLEEVLSTFPEEEVIPEREIFYEDDMIVIYYETNE